MPAGKDARHGDVGEALQLPLLQVGEERHALQQLDRALLRLRHCIDYGKVLAGQAELAQRVSAEAVSLRGPRLKPAPIRASSWPEPITGSPSSFSIAELRQAGRR